MITVQKTNTKHTGDGVGDDACFVVQFGNVVRELFEFLEFSR